MNWAALLSLAVLAAAGPALAQLPALPPDKALPVYVTAHVDVLAEHTDPTIAAIRDYVQASRREPGAVRVESVQEPRPNHFDLIEVWRDLAAYQAHAGSPATVRFHDLIHPWRASPFEERLGSSIIP